MAGWRLSALLHWGPAFSACPCFAVVIAKRRCALVSASSIDKGKAYLSHLGGISHNKNAEVYWIRQTASHLSYLSPALLGFWRVCFLSKWLEEFFGRLSLSSVQQCRESRLWAGLCVPDGHLVHVAMAQKEFCCGKVLTW